MFAANYCIPLLIILFCYFHIVRAVSLREQNLRRQVDKMDAVSLRTDSAANASNMDIHFAKVNLINVTMWVALWTPYVVVVLHGALGQRDMITPLVSTLTFLTTVVALLVCNLLTMVVLVEGPGLLSLAWLSRVSLTLFNKKLESGRGWLGSSPW